MRGTTERRCAEPKCAADSILSAGRRYSRLLRTGSGRIPVGEVAVGRRRRSDRLWHQVPGRPPRPPGWGCAGAAPVDRGQVRVLPDGGRDRDPPGGILKARSAGMADRRGVRNCGCGRSAEGRHAPAARACPDVGFALGRRAEDACAFPEDGGCPDESRGVEVPAPDPVHPVPVRRGEGEPRPGAAGKAVVEDAEQIDVHVVGHVEEPVLPCKEVVGVLLANAEPGQVEGVGRRDVLAGEGPRAVP